MNTRSKSPAWLAILVAISLLASACQSQVVAMAPGASTPDPGNQPAPQLLSEAASGTPIPERPIYAPGELVDYVAQTGDNLSVLAVRFNTTVEEILQANSFIPSSAATMPPGMPMKIPIYYLPLWGTSYQIMPDSLFINGPAQVDFDTAGFIASQPGWLNSYFEFAAEANRPAAEIVDLVALKFSLSPRLLLALLEYRSGALQNPAATDEARLYPLGYRSVSRHGLYRQLLWAANLLNNGYYGWRTGALTSIEREDGRLVRFDPWQNAATVSLHNYFNVLLPDSDVDLAVSPQGFILAYQSLFGDPWQADSPHIPGSLEQPGLTLPFEAGTTWALTGGPHTAWGSGAPLSALDFAPPAVASGCLPTDLWATAVSDGMIVRSETGEIVLDLDGDGDERTGWNIFYLHVGTEGRAPLGALVKQGQPIGHPSCEGGTSTGTHVHIARKYNGEWIPAEGPLAFNLDGWVAHNGSRPYLGTLTRLSETVTACECSNQPSFIRAGAR